MTCMSTFHILHFTSYVTCAVGYYPAECWDPKHSWRLGLKDRPIGNMSQAGMPPATDFTAAASPAWVVATGGSGKTEMARLLFNALAPRFTHRAYLSLNPEDSRQQLQQDLGQLLKGLGMSGPLASSLELLQIKLQTFVQGKAVLLVVDNVWTAEQLDTLLPPPRCFGSGSRVVVTSRCKSLATDGSKRYLVSPLSSCTVVAVGCLVNGDMSSPSEASGHARLAPWRGCGQMVSPCCNHPL